MGPVDAWTEEPTLEEQKIAMSPLPEEERAAEKCDEWTTTPNSLFSCATEEEVENTGVKLILEEGRGKGERFSFYFPLAFSSLTGNELLPPSQVCFAREGGC